MLTYEGIRQFFEYREDGNLYWKQDRYRSKVGNIVGAIVKGSGCKTPYRVVTISGKSYPVHHLVWLYHYGVWPAIELDHKDCDGLNNRIDNLREATKRQNQYNKNLSSHNTSGFRGVSLDKKSGRWRARIRVNDKRCSLGLFETAKEASQAYEKTAVEVQGDFYRVPK